MGYRDFLSDLFDDGRVSVAPYQPLSEQDVADGDAVLAEHERAIRLEAPGQPPPFEPRAACRAGVCFFRACQFAIYRDLPAEAVDEELTQGCGERPSPAVHYSVDIVMRYLPDLIKFSASASEDDPLVTHLMRWAHDWPLSSVGVSDVGGISIDGFASDPGLMQLYADRIIAARDLTRLSDPRARAAVRSAIGMFPHVVGDFAQHLNAQYLHAQYLHAQYLHAQYSHEDAGTANQDSIS